MRLSKYTQLELKQLEKGGENATAEKSGANSRAFSCGSYSIDPDLAKIIDA
jgi:hypothetical protein